MRDAACALVLTVQAVLLWLASYGFPTSPVCTAMRVVALLVLTLGIVVAGDGRRPSEVSGG